jgi:hypothetical protein
MRCAACATPAVSTIASSAPSNPPLRARPSSLLDMEDASDAEEPAAKVGESTLGVPHTGQRREAQLIRDFIERMGQL